MSEIAKRVHLLIIKLLGFKGVIWLTSCVFLWYGKLDGTDWVLVSAAVGGLNVWQKTIKPGEERG